MLKSQGMAEEYSSVVVHITLGHVGAGDWFGVAYRTLGVSVEVEVLNLHSRCGIHWWVTVVEFADFVVEFSRDLVASSALTKLKTGLKHWAAGLRWQSQMIDFLPMKHASQQISLVRSQKLSEQDMSELETLSNPPKALCLGARGFGETEQCFRGLSLISVVDSDIEQYEIRGKKSKKKTPILAIVSVFHPIWQFPHLRSSPRSWLMLVSALYC